MPRISYAERLLYKRLLKYIPRQDIKTQVNIGGHYVDFLIFDRLVIEVDGPYHRERKFRDKKIDNMLRKMGYIVKRVSTEEINRNLERVVEEINSLAFSIA